MGFQKTAVFEVTSAYEKTKTYFFHTAVRRAKLQYKSYFMFTLLSAFFKSYWYNKNTVTNMTP